MTKISLQSIDLINSEGKPTPGLVPIHPIRLEEQTAITIDERVAVFEVALLKGIDFVFFRRFSDGRSSQVAAYVVDNSDHRLDEKALAELHRKVWLQGKAPLLYVAWPGRIDILTCTRGPEFWQDEEEKCQYNPVKKFNVEAIKTAGAISSELQNFSVLRLADGTFWEDPGNRKLADHAKAAHQLLIQSIVDADTSLEGKNNPILRRLLLLMVLIKYLEDRGVFPSGWFSEFHNGAETFLGVLQGGNPGEVYRLLDSLERKFNGNIFALPSQGQQMLTSKILKKFASLVEASTIKRQRSLWKLYSFEHLPVEIISHLYQRFVEGGHGAIYTPPFLASLLLDHAMPYEKLSGEERVLDPACGSGVFLVGVFRRLINIWRSRHDWLRPDVETLKGLLKRSIYGIELDPSAIHLTAFSLSLAICDALQPDVIWRELQFDPLHKSNLFQADFFSLLLDHQQGKPTVLEKGFDLVIGNPPFESKLSIAGTKVDKTVRQQARDRGSLPDNQMAYLFLEQTLTILRSGGPGLLNTTFRVVLQ